ncbi:MAG: helix-turn-helix domain-containing protein, partial [Chitinophagales bacterium]
ADHYKQLHERISAAIHYFINATDEKLLTSLNDHIETMKIKNKTKKYVKELYELKHQVERRKIQLENLMNISKIMNESGSSEDILKATEGLQRPVIIDVPKEQKHRGKIEKGETQKISLQLFKKGKSIIEIARERNLAFSTIEGHLAGFIATGEIDILRIVDKIKLEKISELIEKNPALTSSELKQQLGDDFSYGQIKAVMNYTIHK